jgi:hypothetical protein
MFLQNVGKLPDYTASHPKLFMVTALGIPNPAKLIHCSILREK